MCETHGIVIVSDTAPMTTTALVKYTKTKIQIWEVSMVIMSDGVLMTATALSKGGWAGLKVALRPIRRVI